MANEYAAIKEDISYRPYDEIVEKIKSLTVQLKSAVADFDRRMGVFSDHIDHITRIISLITKIKKEFKEARLKEFESHKKELRKEISELKKNVLQVYKNIHLEISQKDIIIKTEKQLEIDLEELKRLTIKHYNTLEKDHSSFYGIAEKKVAKRIEDAKEAVDKEARAIHIARELINLISRLDTVLQQLASLVGREEEILDKLVIEEGKSIDNSVLLSVERQLAATLREINLLMRDEKQQVHDPFMKLIGQERSGVEHALELIDKKRISWWKRIGRGSPKITEKDIRRTMHKLTEMHEYNTFFSALKSHPELLDDGAVAKLDDLFRQSMQQFQSLKQMAYNDALTKLHNKRYFEEHLEEVLKRGSELSLFLIDIDHFKKFNDTYGHLIGDKVLKEVSDILKRNSRVTDIVCRWGGEELVLLLLRTDLKDAIKTCERIRSEIEKHKVLDFEGKEIRQVTVSGGLVHASENTVNTLLNDARPKKVMEDVFEKADSLLYEAKHGGRNRIVSNEMHPLESLSLTGG